jgi:hypothetical protein
MEISLSKISQSISQFLHRFHLIVFVVLVFGALGLGMFLIYQNILATDDAGGYTAQTSNTTFDSSTSSQVQSLHASDYRLPSDDPNMTVEERSLSKYGRLNPFVE